ncbi:MAG: hypothetical protein RRZ38_00055 [Hafnia sp.]
MSQDASLKIEVQADAVKSATTHLDQLTNAGKKTETAINNLASSARGSNTAMNAFSGSTSNAEKELNKASAASGKMRGTIQNLSWQIQDISVQLQGGTNALVVLGQQGSQIASAFGPGGALVGALIAVGAGIAGVAMNSRDASKAVEQLEKNLNSLTKSQAQQGLIELAKADADLNKKLAEMEGRRKALSVAEQVGGQTKDQLRDITLKLNAEEEAAKVGLQKNAELRTALTGITNGQSKSIQDFTKELELEAKLVNASAVESALLNAERAKGSPLTAAEAAQVRRNAEALEVENKKKEAAAEAERELAKARKEGEKQIKIDDMRRARAEAYLEQVHRQSMTEQQIVSNDYSIKLAKLDEFLAQKAITQGEYDAAEMAAREAYVDQMSALDEKQADKAIKEAGRVAKAKKQVDSQIIGNTQFMLQTTSDMIRDSGAENNGFMKTLLAAQKALAIPSIMASTEMAASAAMAHETVLGGVMSGQMAANLIRAQGAISAGIVAGQAFAGLFDNGGNIPSGQWGIVGEYGPEIVKGPANVTSRKDTAAMARNAMSGGSGGLSITQYITVQGNGDKALINAMQEAARKGAQDGYNQVRQDFATNGSIRRIAGV